MEKIQNYYTKKKKITPLKILTTQLKGVGVSLKTQKLPLKNLFNFLQHASYFQFLNFPNKIKACNDTTQVYCNSTPKIISIPYFIICANDVHQVSTKILKFSENFIISTCCKQLHEASKNMWDIFQFIPKSIFLVNKEEHYNFFIYLRKEQKIYILL